MPLDVDALTEWKRLADAATHAAEVNRIAKLLIDAWAKAEPGHGVTRNPASYVATFADMARAVVEDRAERAAPILMRLTCPTCGELHLDEGEFATKPHHTHACQSCGAVWRPAVVATVGVRFLPGFRNEVAP